MNLVTVCCCTASESVRAAQTALALHEFRCLGEAFGLSGLCVTACIEYADSPCWLNDCC